MGIYNCKKTRRQFLVGTGGALLALPLLPSLMSESAWAQAAPSVQKRMMVFTFGHNSCRESWASPSIASSPVGSSGARQVLLRNLDSITDLSQMLTHPLFNELRMRDQITVLRGLESYSTPQSGHGNMALGGNYHYTLGDIGHPTDFPTFDSIIELSRTVYPATTPSNVRRAIRVSLDDSIASVQKIGDTFQRLPTYGRDASGSNASTVVHLYNDVFSQLTGGTVVPADTTASLKTNILNRVFESFRSFRSSRKVSSDDIARVDQHMSFVSDLMQSYSSSSTQPQLVCTRPDAPTYSANPALFNRNYLDLLVLAFKCGLTKYGSMFMDSHNPTWIPGLSIPAGYNGFHDLIHNSNDKPGYGDGITTKRTGYEAWKGYLLSMIAERFLAPLNVEEGATGRTYLDNMTTAILTENGVVPSPNGGHWHIDYQPMLIGSMAGAIRSGHYVAFPNADTPSPQKMPYNSFLITLLQLMGVPASEYSIHSPGGLGFGTHDSKPSNYQFASRLYTPLTEILT